MEIKPDQEKQCREIFTPSAFHSWPAILGNPAFPGYGEETGGRFMTRRLNFLDLFAGAGGLSEGFIRAGYKPVAHVENDRAACFTLRTRTAWHWLKSQRREGDYYNYLKGNISRSEFYDLIPHRQLDSVINEEIGKNSLDDIFRKIDELLNRDELDLIVGGPPCQAYSIAGRARDMNGMVGDNRNYLYRHYADFLKRYKPKYFVFENVMGLLSAKDADGTAYLSNMRALFKRIGYETDYKILSAEEYGVLQNRKRVILVGKRGKETGFYPMPPKAHSRATVREIFRDLPSIRAGGGKSGPCRMKTYKGQWLFDTKIRNDAVPVTWHQARPNKEQDLEIYRIAVDLWDKNRTRLNYDYLPEYLKTHNNRTSFLDRFKVVAADLPYSHTVVAHIAKDGHYYIHPDIKQNRSITPREAARLQTFPDDYYFESISGVPARTPAFKQIGNAVPVLLAYKLAKKLKDVW